MWNGVIGGVHPLLGRRSCLFIASNQMHHSLQQAISDGIHHSQVPTFIIVLVRLFFRVLSAKQILIKLMTLLTYRLSVDAISTLGARKFNTPRHVSHSSSKQNIQQHYFLSVLQQKNPLLP
jgi:hypothetical protein